MLKKRLIGVITVLDGMAVQSIGFKKYLPLGRPSILAKNLEKWGADEIFIQSIDRSRNHKGPDLELLKSIAKSSLSTPVIYGGGISSIEEGIKAIKTGCERISLDAFIHQNHTEIKDLSLKLGSQAIIASIPVVIKKEKLYWFDYRKEIFKDSFSKLKELVTNRSISEIFIIDKVNEGYQNSFQEKIINLFPMKNFPLILFGGITEKEQIKNFFNMENISSVAIGNSLNYKEHMIQNHKNQLIGSNIRDSFYDKSLI